MITSSSHKDSFFAKIDASPSARNIVNCLIDNFEPYSNIEVHFTGTNKGDLRVRAFRAPGFGISKRNIFTMQWSASQSCFVCRILSDIVAEKYVTNVRKVKNPLPVEFNLNVDINHDSAGYWLVKTIEAKAKEFVEEFRKK